MSAFVRKYRFVVLGAVGLALVAAALLTERARGPSEAGEVPVAGQLGPTPGPDAEGYIAEKTEHLSAVAVREPERPAASLVSFARLLAVSEVRQLADDMRLDVVFALFPGSEHEVLAVSPTLEATVAERVGDLQGSMEEPPAELDPDCACIYAVVVSRTTLGGLAALQEHPDVRLVDVPEPPVADLRGWELTPLFPGES